MLEMHAYNNIVLFMAGTEVRFGGKDIKESRSNRANFSALAGDITALSLSSDVVPLPLPHLGEGAYRSLSSLLQMFRGESFVESTLSQSSQDSNTMNGISDDDHSSRVSSENPSTNGDSDLTQESCEVEDDEDVDQAFDDNVLSYYDDSYDVDEMSSSDDEDSEDLKCWKFLYNEIPDSMQTTKVLQKLFIK